jgi:hypothetical protein
VSNIQGVSVSVERTVFYIVTQNDHNLSIHDVVQDAGVNEANYFAKLQAIRNT